MSGIALALELTGTIDPGEELGALLQNRDLGAWRLAMWLGAELGWRVHAICSFPESHETAREDMHSEVEGVLSTVAGRQDVSIDVHFESPREQRNFNELAEFGCTIFLQGVETVSSQDTPKPSVLIHPQVEQLAGFSVWFVAANFLAKEPWRIAVIDQFEDSDLLGLEWSIELARATYGSLLVVHSATSNESEAVEKTLIDRLQRTDYRTIEGGVKTAVLRSESDPNPSSFWRDEEISAIVLDKPFCIRDSNELLDETNASIGVDSFFDEQSIETAIKKISLRLK